MVPTERVHCSRCGKPVSGVDPELGLVVRAWVQCPECFEAEIGALVRMEALGRQGFTISICYGPSGAERACRWSVNVLANDGQEFDRPFAADSFQHAIEIADLEIKARGWTGRGQ